MEDVIISGNSLSGNTLGAVSEGTGSRTGTIIQNNAGIAATILGNLTGSVSDDGVVDLGNIAPTTRIIAIASAEGFGTDANSWFVTLRIRTSSSPLCSFAQEDASSTEALSASTSDVGGTTGADGGVTFSATDGHFKIENRSGGGQNFRYWLYR